MKTPKHATAIAALFGLLTACSDTPAPDQTAIQAPVEAAPTQVADQAGSGPVEPPAKDKAAPAAARAGDARELEWDALIPDDYRPDKLLSEYQIDDLSDEDPRAQELMDKLKALWDQAPVREDLDGATIRLPGFIVPVEADEKETTGFLLVPYYGACVHVPPPPANQTVYVVTEAGRGTRPELFDVVWVSGTMSVKRIENDVAEAGYTLYATDIVPYE